MPLAPEPSRLRRVTAAVRRWAAQSVWRALAFVVGLGTVAGLALGFGIIGPFWGPIAGGLVFVTLGVTAVSWIDAPSWQRGVVAILFFGPTMALVAVIGPMYDAAFARESSYTTARRIGEIPARQGCIGIYAYEVEGTTYRLMVGRDGCPDVPVVEYIVDDPERARPKPKGSRTLPPRP